MRKKNTTQESFSCKGIRIAVDYFAERGHKDIKVFVPRFRRGQSNTKCPTRDPEILDELEKKGHLIYTPSRYVDNKLILPYDDRFILKTAVHFNAVILSNDNYKDLCKEKAEWKRHIEKNLIGFSFVGDLLLIADDPMGRNGPTLDEFLSIQSNTTNENASANNSKPNGASNNNASVKKINQYQWYQYESKNNEAASNSFKPNRSGPIYSPHTASELSSQPNNFIKAAPIPALMDQISIAPMLTKARERYQLENHLAEIFPQSSTQEIRNILNRYPDEKNLNFFIMLFLND